MVTVPCLMAGSQGIWLEFRATCDRNMLPHTVRMWLWQPRLIRKKDTEGMRLSKGSILTLLLLLHCIQNSVKHIYKSSLSWIIFTYTVPYNHVLYLNCAAAATAALFRDSGRAVLYSIHDRHFGIMDEYFMAWWIGIQPEMLLAVDTVHTITPPWYTSSPWNVNVKWSEM